MADTQVQETRDQSEAKDQAVDAKAKDASSPSASTAQDSQAKDASSPSASTAQDSQAKESPPSASTAQASQAKDSSPPPAAEDRDKAEGQLEKVKTNFRKLTPADKVLAPIAALVIVGWITLWVGDVEPTQLFKSWFQTLSFFGALAVVVLAIAKLFGKQLLADKYETKCLGVATLLPVAGFMIHIITTIGTFLTIGGSLALAYFSVTTYWRKSIPQFATDPLRQESPAPSRPASDTPASDKSAQESVPDKDKDKANEKKGDQVAVA